MHQESCTKSNCLIKKMLKKFDVNKSISVFGARENNLQNIDIQIPRNKLVVFTGKVEVENLVWHSIQYMQR